MDASPIFVVLLPAGESELQAKGTQKVGWGQDGLSPKGIEQAKKAGKLMSQSGIQFDAVFTSVQKQAVYTAWTALMEGDDLAVPQYKSYRLNDRHWGKLQGRSEKDLEQSYDQEHLKNWLKDAPPPLEHSNVQHPVQDPLYRAIPQTLQPGSESMRNVFDRVLPLLSDNITPMLQMGKSILVVGHEASIYAMCQLLEGDDECDDEEFPQGEPWILEIDQELFVRKKVVLNDGFLRRLQFRFSDTAGELVPSNPGKAAGNAAGNASNGAEAGNAAPAAPAPPKVKEEYTIEVTILSAKNLRDADWMYGTSDPYCWIKTSNKSHGVRRSAIQSHGATAPIPADHALPASGKGLPKHCFRSWLQSAGSVGFFYLEGHGIAPEEIEHLHALAKQFFSLPTAVKDSEGPAVSSCFLVSPLSCTVPTSEEEIAMSGAPPLTGRGYQRCGLPGSSPGADRLRWIDQVRRFVQARNLWPSEPPEFRAAAEAYFAKVSEVGNALMRAMAVGLGLPEHFFDSVTDRSFWCVRVIGYPALHRDQLNLSCGEHTDYGCWTILAQDQTPDALEVQLPGGHWEKVQPRPGAFVVNLGDMLSVWTRGRYVATRHRVRQTAGDYRTELLPPCPLGVLNFHMVLLWLWLQEYHGCDALGFFLSGLEPARTSIAFFYEPNFDAVIRPLDLSPLPQAIEHRPVASTEPLARGLAGQELIYGEHLFAKVSSNFDFEEILASTMAFSDLFAATHGKDLAEDEPFSTKTIFNASNVVKWDEKKTIKIKRGTSLHFSIWDEDWGKKDDHLGECTLKFEDILENFNGKMALLEQNGKSASAAAPYALRMLLAARPSPVRVWRLLPTSGPSFAKPQAPRHVFPVTASIAAAVQSKRRMSAPRLGLGSASEVEASYTLEGGYGTEALPDGTGAWLAHRAHADVPGSGPGNDWVSEAFGDPEDKLGTNLAEAAGFKVPSARLTHPPRILVLYGSLRPSSFSRKLACECARLLELLGADVRLYCPMGLPVRDPALEEHPKALSSWSEGHVWVSPEMHGTITAAFKNQIDWLPLNTGSVRPTQGRTCVVLQVNGGSQSFNVVNELRRLARMKESDFRDRVVDVIEEPLGFPSGSLLRAEGDCAEGQAVDTSAERSRESKFLMTVAGPAAHAICTRNGLAWEDGERRLPASLSEGSGLTWMEPLGGSPGVTQLET
eukprot:s92_g23.t2